jgi:3-oxoacyl-[acyl-carrier protein] reductase
VDADNPPTDEQIYAAKSLPNQMVMLGCSGTINDAADSIFWLCSPMSGYMTGQVLAIEGGACGGLS